MEKAVPKEDGSEEKPVKDPFKASEEESKEIEPEELVKWPSNEEKSVAELPIPKSKLRALKNRLLLST